MTQTNYDAIVIGAEGEAFIYAGKNGKQVGEVSCTTTAGRRHLNVPEVGAMEHAPGRL